MKKALALCLALCLLLVSVSALAASEIYHYDEEVTLTAYARYNSTYVSDPENLWMYEWARDKMNINFEVTGVTEEQAGEFTTLMFASGDLPDVLLNWSNLANRAQLAVYGEMEQMILPIDDYISEDVTPNLCGIIEEFPEIYSKLAQGDGKLYMFPQILQQYEARTNLVYHPLWVKTELFKAVGYETLPTTLDEFLDALRKIKAYSDENGLNLVPLGGASSYDAFVDWLMPAFGFNVPYSSYYTAIMNGDFSENDMVIYPYHDNYLEFLKFMNTLYTEGLMEQDYYTLDSAQINARIAANSYAAVAEWNMYTYTDDFADWEMLTPLTSQWQDNPIVACSGNTNTTYHLFLCEGCSNPEAAMRFMDLAYDPDYKYLYYWGPQAGVDDTYGMAEGWKWSEDGGTRILLDVESGKFESSASYCHSMTPFGATGNMIDRRTDGSEVALYDPATGDGYTKLQTIERYCPYYSARYPGALFDADTQAHIGDLETVIKDYVNSETAKFVTGVRPVTEEEFAKYRADLDSMGMTEYNEIQQQAFEEQYR